MHASLRFLSSFLRPILLTPHPLQRYGSGNHHARSKTAPRPSLTTMSPSRALVASRRPSAHHVVSTLAQRQTNSTLPHQQAPGFFRTACKMRTMAYTPPVFRNLSSLPLLCKISKTTTSDPPYSRVKPNSTSAFQHSLPVILKNKHSSPL